MDYLLQLYVPMIAGGPVEGHVSVQGCVGVTLAIQGHTAWKVRLCS